MPAGLGGGGAVGIALESTMGVYTAPTVWVPILSESFQYREDKYYSPQIREQTIVSDVQQSYYHVEGDIRMEVDPNYEPYFMTASRHITTLASGVYKSIPSSLAALTDGLTLSLTIIRNGIVFGYAGCCSGGYEYTIDNGVLVVTRNMYGLSEAVQSLPARVWAAPLLFGAASHSVYVAASGVTPTFGANDVNFNGFTFNANFNAAAQNRIVPSRAATYISFGETEATYNTELDFTSRAEYDNFVNATTRAVRLESLKGGSTWGTATSGFRITINRSAYDTYEVGLGGMGDLIMAGTTGRVIGIAGGDAYSLECRSSVTL